MAYHIEDKLVIAVASSALFDLSESDRVYREQGVTAYREYQQSHENDLLGPGAAFPLVKRLLSLNEPYTQPPSPLGQVALTGGESGDPRNKPPSPLRQVASTGGESGDSQNKDNPVEVVLLSRNDPETGLRVFNSIEAYGLPVIRAAFLSGGDTFRYLETFNAALFLSANRDDVRAAVAAGAPAGQVFPTQFVDDESQPELRIAFDFDGVIADDSAESVHRRQGLESFEETEVEMALDPLRAGPLHRFFAGVARLQARELERNRQDPSHQPRVRIALITTRAAPAHKRVVNSLREWGLAVDEAFFLGGIDKTRVLQVFRPHIFFDDRLDNIEVASEIVPSAHVPFGIGNRE